VSEQNSKANDYALAKSLNERVIKIFTLVVDHASTPDLTAVNRSYVLLVHELKQIYARQPELQKIGHPICWRVLDNLEQIHETGVEYIVETVEDYMRSAADYGQEHNSSVSTLCIIANIKKPSLTSQIQKLLNEADGNIVTFKSELDKMYATLSFESISMPVVSIGGTKYHFSSMRDGLARNIISYCLEKRTNKEIEINVLKSELKEAKITAHGLTNLREDIRNSYFGEKHPLSPFVTASSKAILVRRSTALTDQQIDAIKAACKQLFSE